MKCEACIYYREKLLIDDKLKNNYCAIVEKQIRDSNGCYSYWPNK